MYNIFIFIISCLNVTSVCVIYEQFHFTVSLCHSCYQYNRSISIGTRLNTVYAKE